MDQTPITIAVIVGTTRQQRLSIQAAKFVAKVGQDLPGVTIIFVDPLDFNLPGDGNDPEGKDARYTDITAQADAFFIVTPEYNHSFPGSLKRLLDSELANYIHKPVAIAGVSNGSWGGVRAVESLVPAVREMGLAVTFTSAYFARVQDLFDDQGNAKEERTLANVQKAYAELLWMARVLKHGRNTMPKA